MRIRQYIPNLLTCINMMFGCYGCILALSGNYGGALVAIIMAAGFDFADGLAARLFNAYSPIGKDLDSLADMVSFGVAPGMMLFDFLDRTQQTVDWSNPIIGKSFLFVAFVIPVFSGLRLAKFNNDSRQTTSFIGLPVPAHALFWASLIHVLSLSVEGNALSGLFPSVIAFTLPYVPSSYFLIGVSLTAIISSLLLVSEIPMMAMKIKSLVWKGNEIRYTLIILAVVFIACLGSVGIALTILLYIILSVLNKPARADL